MPKKAPHVPCAHCNEPSTQKFCCTGCEAAHALLTGLNLQSYYQKRILSPKNRALIPEKTTLTDLTPYLQREENSPISTLHLMVDGLHCAACIWLIETILAKQKGVTKARLNMTTKRLTLSFDTTQTTGNTLINTVQSLGYRLMPYNPKTLAVADEKHLKFLLLCLSVAGFATANVMLLSVALWAGATQTPATHNMLQWFSALVTLPAIAFAGQPFYRSAIKALAHKHMNMDVPISLAVIITAGLSLYDTLTKTGETYFESAIMLLFFLLIGRYLDHLTRHKTRSTAEHLLSLQASAATIIDTKTNTPLTLPIEKLRIGMVLLIARGETFPADGIVIEGTSTLNTSLLTGESLPQDITQNSLVKAGCINLSAPIKVRITAVGNNTELAHIASLVEEATTAKNKYTRLADRIAKSYSPFVHLLAAVTFVGWWFLGGIGIHEAIIISTTVLIVTCPCAIGLAVPAVQVAAVSRLLRMGVILKSATALEKLKDIQSIVFDKTGTLTTGILTLVNKPPHTVLQMASNMALHSTHPLSQALVRALTPSNTALTVKETVGKGLSTTYKGLKLRLGNRQFCHAEKQKAPPLSAGQTELWIWQKKETSPARLTQFIFEDTIRPDAKETISAFKKLGFSPFLLSGDQPQTVKKMAKLLGFDTYKAQVSPAEKQTVIKNLPRPLMCGDGLNDTPALASAYVSLTMCQASDISKHTADIILQNNALTSAVDTYKLSKIAHKTVKNNFAFAFVYNAFAVPIAMAGFISPLLAALLMSGSSIVVVLNSTRLAKIKI